MANTQNLKPFNTMTAELHRELSRRGGQASGAARRTQRERIDMAKAEKRAESELFNECVRMVKEYTRMWKMGI